MNQFQKELLAFAYANYQSNNPSISTFKTRNMEISFYYQAAAIALEEYELITRSEGPNPLSIYYELTAQGLEAARQVETES